MEAYTKRPAQPESPRPYSFSSSDFFFSFKSFFTDPAVEVISAYCPFCNDYVVLVLSLWLLSRACDLTHSCAPIAVGRSLSVFVSNTRRGCFNVAAEAHIF